MFHDSGSLFGLLYDSTVVAWRAAAASSKLEADAATRMDEDAAGALATRWLTGTHAVLEVIFAAAVATMAFLSYHIVRLWAQDCGGGSGSCCSDAYATDGCHHHYGCVRAGARTGGCVGI